MLIPTLLGSIWALIVVHGLIEPVEDTSARLANRNDAPAPVCVSFHESGDTRG